MWFSVPSWDVDTDEFCSAASPPGGPNACSISGVSVNSLSWRGTGIGLALKSLDSINSKTENSPDIKLGIYPIEYWYYVTLISYLKKFFNLSWKDFSGLDVLAAML